MATRVPVSTTLANGVMLYVWSGLLNGDDGAPVQVPWLPDKTVHYKGTFGAGAAAKLQGSNDGATVAVFGATTVCILRSPDSVAISMGAEDMKQVLEDPNWLRPVVTAGDGTTNLQCFLTCRPPRRTL
jgi:hypothetical protein